MKFGFRTVIPGMTQDQYDHFHAIVGPKGETFPGAVLHIAGPAENGWFIMEVWDSKEDYERFAREVMAPVMPPGAPMPQLQEFEVHSVQISH